MYRCCLPRLWGLLGPHRRGGRRIVLARALEERITPSFTVMNAGDTGAGTLRQAIIDANNSPGADTIVFDSTFFSTPRTIVINSAPQQIGGQLTITGPGASLLTVQRGAGGLENSRRPFDSVATSLTISGMTITGGNVTGANGGGIQAAGVTPNITLDSVVLTSNNTNGLGGAIYVGNGGTLTIRNSVVSRNTAANGGGIYFFSNGSLVMENCTISGNSATWQARRRRWTFLLRHRDRRATNRFHAQHTPHSQQHVFRQHVQPVRSAIAVDTFTGALQFRTAPSAVILPPPLAAPFPAAAQARLPFKTARSRATPPTERPPALAAVVARSSTLNNAITIVNSIVSGNSNANAPDIRTDPFTTTHVNFSAIGSTSGFTLAPGSGNNLPVGVNLMLAALASNGGTTQTHAIQPGSPLIDAGSNASVPAALTTDQRGSGFRISGLAGGHRFIRERRRSHFPVGPVLLSHLSSRSGFHFQREHRGHPDLAGLMLNNLTTHASIPTSQLQLVIQQNHLIVNYSPGVLPDGNYVATVPAGALVDAFQNVLASERDKRQAGDALRALLELGAKDVAVLVDGVETAIPSTGWPSATTSWSAPGRRSRPTASSSGRGALDSSLLTGEPVAGRRGPGDEVTGATINPAGGSSCAPRGSARRPGSPRSAGWSPTPRPARPVQRLADRISAVFVPSCSCSPSLTLGGGCCPARRAGRVHRRRRGADHRVPVRPRPGDAHRAAGRHRPRGAARHPDQGSRGARADPARSTPSCWTRPAR